MGVQSERSRSWSQLRALSDRWRLTVLGTLAILGVSVIRGDLLQGVVATLLCGLVLALLDTYIARVAEDPEDDEVD